MVAGSEALTFLFQGFLTVKESLQEKMGKWLNFEISGSLNLISKQEMKMLIFRLFVPSLGWVNVLHPLISNAHFSGGLPPSSTPPDPGFRTELATDSDVNIYILGRGSKAVRFQPITLLIR